MMMRRGIQARIGGCLLGWMVAFGPVAPTHAASDQGYNEARSVALAIADAFKLGKAKTFRVESTRQLERLAHMESPALTAALRATIDVAIERGAQGLEGAVSSTASALASRDAAGWTIARKELTRLAKHYRIDTAVKQRPNAAAGIVRPGSPIVHYLPIGIARKLIESQLATGTLDLETAFGEALCSEQAIADLKGRYGAAVAAAALLRCGQIDSGERLDAGMSLGFGGELSILDCLSDHTQTRAERVDALMRSCEESLLTAGGGDPLASGSLPADEVFPLPPTVAGRPQRNPDGSWSIRHRSEQGAEIMSDRIDETSITTTYYSRDDGAAVLRTETDIESGRLTRMAALEGGKEVESVDLAEDNSYVVRRYDEDGNVTHEQAYDADGNPIGGAANAGSPGMDYGATPECRQLTVALVAERATSLLAGQGLIDPRVVNPRPDAPVTDAGDLECLGLQGGAALDAAFGCNAQVAMCTDGYILDASCACRKSQPAMTPQRQCGMFMMCDDGVPPAYVDGSCTCGDIEQVLFLDEGVAPSPRPSPIGSSPGL